MGVRGEHTYLATQVLLRYFRLSLEAHVERSDPFAESEDAGDSLALGFVRSPRHSLDPIVNATPVQARAAQLHTLFTVISQQLTTAALRKYASLAYFFILLSG